MKNQRIFKAGLHGQYGLSHIVVDTSRVFLHCFSQCAGLILSIFFLVNMWGELLIPHFGIDIPGLICPVIGGFPGKFILMLSAFGIILFAFLPRSAAWNSIKSRFSFVFYMFEALTVCSILLMVFHSIEFYLFLFSGLLDSLFPFPFSLFAALVLVVNIGITRWEFFHDRRVGENKSRMGTIISYGTSFFFLLALIPFILILFYGTTYCPHTIEWGEKLEPADCIIVYGARIKNDGNPSHALAVRVLQGVSLYENGRGYHLVMSGGYNPDGVSESSGMKNFAVSMGVPQARILTDEEGYGTFDTAINSKWIMEKRGWHRSISVSHYYHLLRIKLAAHRVGLDTDTIPTAFLNGFKVQPWNLLREIPALYYYYFFKWGNNLPLKNNNLGFTRLKASLQK